MTQGTPINRQWVCTLHDGTPIIDWGNGRAQDMFTGEFLDYDGNFSHGITDNELYLLVRAGRVVEFDNTTVYINALPDPPQKTLD